MNESSSQALRRTGRERFPAFAVSRPVSRRGRIGVVGVTTAFLAIFVFLVFVPGSTLCRADAVSKSTEEESLSDVMAGDYDLIGRKPDSTTTYSGKVTLRVDGANLRVTRTIAGKTSQGTAHFETVAGSDRIPVLRFRFVLDGVEYEATYRWHTDPDNYFRFTGIIGHPGTKSPGLEALFPIHK
ncbi:hypothetical protein CfE428DRAFT_6548 [Chthoniobacter flavus Ellin428]|uniref:Uncharacterized protein n=1 Tax=Chthoniobacter flavus Ellin428 TaxID=497964 RepID=B4DCA7_9BACT|nr:hypothetical protein [Chthoniobacter flavus]EDY15937.1 hypothetical protein CfE428DRAFT_6548 [Chthoniobacter flavus Ellin428]